MPVRKASAVWEGDLKSGKGNVKLQSGAFAGPYSFATRFEEAPGTNPEELVAAAHAACFSMALSAGLAKSGFKVTRVSTDAKVHLEKVGEGFGITRIELITEVSVPGIDDATFRQHADNAKKNCPISKALAATPIDMTAKLV